MRSSVVKRRKFERRIYASLVLAVILIALGSIGYYRYSQPIDPATVQVVLADSADSQFPLEFAWPLAAQASVGTVEDGLIASEPEQIPLPTASTAKLITVMTVLKEKPLALGEQGPMLTIDESDISIYNQYSAANGSLVTVQLGEQLSQYQMLQGILIRSGNNLADSLAIWAFGSLSEYQIAAQEMVDELGLANTIVGIDASGLSPTTTSTADDLTRLGIAAMKNDVVREIVRQETSDLPFDGIRPSTNWMLGTNGVIGIKTGNIPQVGGVFVIASEYTPQGEEPEIIVATVQGSPSTFAAISIAGQLAEAVKPHFIKINIISKGDLVARISTPWGETSDIVAADAITAYPWKYNNVKPVISVNNQTPVQKYTPIGSYSLGEQTVDLVTSTTINEPSWQWRLLTNR